MVATKKMKKMSTNVTDPVADLLTRIRNANIAYKDETLAPVSKQSRAILAILQEEGYITGFEQEGEGVHQAFRVQLKYGPRGERVITGIQRVSRPGRRVYFGRDDVPEVLGGLGTAILTTSRGVMTGREAVKAGVGGEVLCNIW